MKYTALTSLKESFDRGQLGKVLGRTQKIIVPLYNLIILTL
jgi:hypothetical protein